MNNTVETNESYQKCKDIDHLVINKSFLLYILERNDINKTC